MKIKNDINAIIDEIFVTEYKTLIPRYEEVILLADNIQISRKSIKYIIDARKNDNYGLKRVKRMFERAPEAFDEGNPDFSNPTKKYPDSRIAVGSYPYEGEALIVVYDPIGSIKQIFNCYYRPIWKLKGPYKDGR